MSNMEDRQKGFENKFAHDAELEFKAIARRNKLVGLWAAEKLGKKGEDASAYAKDVVMADLERAGHQDVVDKLLADFKQAEITVSASEIEQQIQDLLPVARKQLLEG